MARLGRAQPIQPHLSHAIVAPGGPVSVVGHRTQVGDVATRNRGYLSGAGRMLPLRAHLAAPIAGAPAGPPPLAPAIVVGQARQRMLIGRRCTQPHYARPNLTPAPVVAPGAFRYQADSRSVRRPKPPAPHLAPALVGAPAPPPPKTQPGFQAIRRTTYVQVTRHDPGADGEKATRDRQIVKRYWDR